MHRSNSTAVSSVACLALLLGLPLSALPADTPRRETVAPGPTAPPVHLGISPTGSAADAQRPPGTARFADRMPVVRPVPGAGRPTVRHRVPSDLRSCDTALPGERRPLPVADCYLPFQPPTDSTPLPPHTI
ncbi:hypothetical protein RMN57_08880 [Kitasatospora sp. CM 4170]|uniref:Secreted protein n=1 Tax=Kitasatospora aburaviensis TaxID=67265 RepID=A0ABW1ET75_9ACTN|nr:hypothetical protein [Kitasatospora sp. CM 4170]WNM44824.1 hypothetical protein RMN57_08880 [Kitasatospora sp. CM 4170]